MNRSDTPSPDETAGQDTTPPPDTPAARPDRVWVNPPGRTKRVSRALIDERRAEVAHLHAMHQTNREIARILGCSPGTVSDDLTAVRKQWRENAMRDIGPVLGEEIAKLDLLERSWLPKALDHADPEHAARAAHVLDRVRQHRARLLGLNAPTRHEVTGEGGGPVRIESVETLRAEGMALVDELEELRRRRAAAG